FRTIFPSYITARPDTRSFPTRRSSDLNYYRASGDYTRQGRGDTATHKLFTERSWTLLNNGGRLGYVVPSGIYTDLGTKALREMLDRKSTRLNSSHVKISYAVFCLKKKK